MRHVIGMRFSTETELLSESDQASLSSTSLKHGAPAATTPDRLGGVPVIRLTPIARLVMAVFTNPQPSP